MPKYSLHKPWFERKNTYYKLQYQHKMQKYIILNVSVEGAESYLC